MGLQFFMSHKYKEIAAYRHFPVWAAEDLNSSENPGTPGIILTFAATFIKAIWQQNKIKNYPVIETRLFIKKRGEKNWHIQIQREMSERGELLPQSIKKNKQVSDKLATLAQKDKRSRVALQNNQISKPLSS